MRRIAAWNSRKCPEPVAVAVVAVTASICALVAPLAQQPGIAAVIRTEVVRVSPPAPAGPAKNPDGSPNAAAMMAQMGDMLAKLMAPEGKIEMLWMARPGVVRTELRNAMFIIPSGSVLLTKGSTLTVLNPSQRTYYEMPTAGTRPGAARGAGAMKPDVTVTQTGRTDTVLGHRVERVDINVKMAAPGRTSAGGSPAAARDITVTMEVWETPDFGTTADPMMMAGFQGLMASAGMEKMVRPGRFPLKSILRTSMMPGYETRTTTLEVTQKALPDDLFVIPEGFKKVDPPRLKFP